MEDGKDRERIRKENEFERIRGVRENSRGRILEGVGIWESQLDGGNTEGRFNNKELSRIPISSWNSRN
jgi:hypothetical protein